MFRSVGGSRFRTRLCSVVLGLSACDGDPEPEEEGTAEALRSAGPVCEPVDLDPRRALFETNVEVLAPFTMRAVLKHAARNAGYRSTPEETYQRIIDTYATGENGRFAEGQHCDDEVADPRFSHPGGCGLLGCDQQFFCAAHDSACFACNAEGTGCQVDTGLPPGEHAVCSFDDVQQLCTFDGRRVTGCAPAEDGACDDAGCDALGCDAVQLCDPTFELCIVCTAELDECRVDFGVPDEPVEGVCQSTDMCEFDVAAGTVSGCEPDPVCEEAQCGSLGCEAQFVCTPDFLACFGCTGDGQRCELEGQEVPSPTPVCTFDGRVCTFDGDALTDCVEDVDGICDGFGGGDTGGTTGIGGGESFGDVDGGSVSVGSASVGSFGEEGGGFISAGDEFGGETSGGEDDGSATSFGGSEDGGGGGDEPFGAIGGYPLECPRIEAAQIDNIDQWFPISISNRFDLAPADGAHCGQQRIVMANNAQGRMFMIFEAQIPNPSPECGLAACRPIAEFWTRMNDLDDPIKRRKQLVKAFFTGHPKLEEAGIGPFVNADHYTFGAGQVRTNNFDDFPWTLREFKLVAHPDANPYKPARVHAVQVPVSYSPIGDHFNDAMDTPLGPECRESFLVAMDGLLGDEPNAMSFHIDEACKAAESRDDFVSDFAQQLVLGTGEFEAAIEARLAEAGSPLTAIDIANRAHFAGACIGCHEQTNGIDLGNGVTAPSSAGFTHTMEFFTEDCGTDGQCFPISDALSTSFLPHRKAVLEGFLAQTPCEDACEVDDGYEYVQQRGGPVGLLRALRPGQTALRPGRRLDVQSLLALEREARRRGAPQTVGGQSTMATH